jgi:regulator of protease activity HflC (stomatin/prohibitin superfamily)
MSLRLRLLLLTAPFALSVGCGSTVQPGYKGLLNYPLSSGLQRQVYSDGFVWHSPFADMITFDVTWTTSTENVDVITAEGLHLTVQLALRYRPVQSELYDLVTDVGTNYYDEVLGPEFRTATRGEFAKYKYLDIATTNEKLENDVEDEIRRRIAGKHIEIDSVTIEHVDYPPDIASAVEQKLVVSQKAEEAQRELDLEQKEEAVKKAEAEGQAQADSISAQSAANVAKIQAQQAADNERTQAQADADADRIRAQGQADADKLVGGSLSQQVLEYLSFQSLEKLGASGAKFFLFPGEWHQLPSLFTTQSQ